MNVAILGFGTVGSGVYDVLKMNSEKIKRSVGEELNIKYVLDLREFPGNPVSDVLVHDFNVIVNDPSVDVVAEVMGGVNPAYDFSKRAILAGKSVCTSNKELVARHGAELMRLAHEHNCNYLFEASVGGGIPIIRPLNSCLTADEILEIKSIVNGTTNYILTRMRDDKLMFEDALKEAQDNGFAERNPAADIEGTDAARKTVILASLASGKQADGEDIYTEGITKISADDIEYAKKLGVAIKLISYIKCDQGKNYAMVSPRMINPDCQLYNVDGVFNALLVSGNAVGDVMFMGRGAGKLPTASAVAGDIVEAAKLKGTPLDIRWTDEKLKLAGVEELQSKFFVRVSSSEESEARKLFAIERVIENSLNEFAFVTEPMSGKAFGEAADKIAIINSIRADI